MCLSIWSLLDLVKGKDIFAVTAIAEVEDDKETLEVGMPFSSIFFSL